MAYVEKESVLKVIVLVFESYEKYDFSTFAGKYCYCTYPYISLSISGLLFV